MKILGLVIANAFVALSGAVVCHEQRAFSATMGTGQMVFGLAAVIIGSTIFKKVRFRQRDNGRRRRQRAVQSVHTGRNQFGTSGKPAEADNVGAVPCGPCSRQCDRKGEGRCLSLNISQRYIIPALSQRRACLMILILPWITAVFVSVVGSNGSGKTSMLNIICGNIPISQGKVVINGVNINSQKDFRRYKTIGRVYQDPAMGTCPDLTILENMSLALITRERGSAFHAA